MRDIIFACAGFIIAIGGGVYLARLLYYKKFGVAAKAEVLDANEVLKRKGAILGSVIFVGKRVDHYMHTMRYDFDGRTYEEQDRAGYTQPLKIGSTHIILCDPKNPKKFKFEEDVAKHITIAAALVAVAVLFAGRFFYEYMK